MKKAEGLGLGTIGVAILVLIVVVVLIAVFTDVLNGVIPSIKGQTECSGRGGDCMTVSSCGDGAEIYGLGCPETGDGPDDKYCCIPD